MHKTSRQKGRKILCTPYMAQFTSKHLWELNTYICMALRFTVQEDIIAEIRKNSWSKLTLPTTTF